MPTLEELVLEIIKQSPDLLTSDDITSRILSSEGRKLLKLGGEDQIWYDSMIQVNKALLSLVDHGLLEFTTNRKFSLAGK